MPDRELDVVTGANRVPAGGSTGQVLRKSGAPDYQTEWAAPESAGPVEQERIYKAPYWDQATYSLSQGWNSTRLAPEITVPALGNPPNGYKWLIDVIGGIRLRDPAANTSVLFGVGFDRIVENSTVDGGGIMFSGFQASLPVSAFALDPPATTRSFTVNFYIFVSPAGTYRVAPGPYPVCRCYLVRA